MAENGTGNHPDKRTASGSNRASLPPVSFDRSVENDVIRVDAELSDRPGWSYNPKTMTGLDATASVEDGKALYDDLMATTPSMEDGRTIYLVAITNGSGLNDELVAGYNRIAAGISETPLIGCWKSASGKKYYDAVYPAQFESEEEVKNAGRQYRQEALFVIFTNGETATLQI